MSRCPGCGNAAHWLKTDVQACISAVAMFHSIHCTDSKHHPDCKVREMQEYMRETNGRSMASSC